MCPVTFAGLPETGFPDIRPAAGQIADALMSARLLSRCFLIVSQSMYTAFILRSAVVRAWLDPDVIVGSGCVGDATELEDALVPFDASTDLASLQWRLTQFVAERRVWCLVVDDIEKMGADRTAWLVEHAGGSGMLPGGLAVIVARDLACVPDPVRECAVTFPALEATAPRSPYAMSTEVAREERARDLDGAYWVRPLAGHLPEAEAATSTSVMWIRHALREHMASACRTAHLPGIYHFGAYTALPRSACARANGFASLVTVDCEQIDVLPEPATSPLLHVGRFVVAETTIEAGLNYPRGVEPIARIVTLDEGV